MDWRSNSTKSVHGLGTLRAAAMDGGPWCGLIVLWCGWTTPDGDEGARMLSPEELDTLKENLTLENTDEYDQDFPNWTRNNAAGRALGQTEARVLAPEGRAGRERCERVLIYAGCYVPGCELACALNLAERLNEGGPGTAVVTGPDVKHFFSERARTGSGTHARDERLDTASRRVSEQVSCTNTSENFRVTIHIHQLRRRRRSRCALLPARNAPRRKQAS